MLVDVGRQNICDVQIQRHGSFRKLLHEIGVNRSVTHVTIYCREDICPDLREETHQNVGRLTTMAKGHCVLELIVPVITPVEATASVLLDEGSFGDVVTFRNINLLRLYAGESFL